MEQTLACMGYFDYLVCRGLGGGGGQKLSHSSFDCSRLREIEFVRWTFRARWRVQL